MKNNYIKYTIVFVGVLLFFILLLILFEREIYVENFEYQTICSAIDGLTDIQATINNSFPNKINEKKGISIIQSEIKSMNQIYNKIFTKVIKIQRENCKGRSVCIKGNNFKGDKKDCSLVKNNDITGLLQELDKIIKVSSSSKSMSSENKKKLKGKIDDVKKIIQQFKS
jgi:hypothetical protein